jgi:hypothetical protein
MDHFKGSKIVSFSKHNSRLTSKLKKIPVRGRTASHSQKG